MPFAEGIPDGAMPLDQRFQLAVGASLFGQEPGAELPFNVRKHVVSLFIFKNSPELDRHIGSAENFGQKLSFNVESWSEGELRYIIVSDAGPADLSDLRARVQQGAR